MLKTTIKDLIKMDIDIDVCDDYDESCYIAFIGAVELTEQGKKEFATIMDIEVEVYDDMALLCDIDESNINPVSKFFRACAGYCSVENYNNWFVDEI